MLFKIMQRFLRTFFDTFLSQLLVVLIAHTPCLTAKQKSLPTAGSNLHLHDRHVRALILKSVWGVFSAACRMTNQKKSVCHTHKYIYYEAAPLPLSLFHSVCELNYCNQCEATKSIWVVQGLRTPGRGGVWKVVEVKQATSFEQLANYALQLLSQAPGGVDAALNDLQVKWIITTANAKKQDEVPLQGRMGEGRQGVIPLKAYSYSWHGSNCQVSFVN